MKSFPLFFVALVACGGTTIPTNDDAGKDASNDAAADAPVPIPQCNGYCPQPNGSKCTSDCDCYNKCISGVCVDPVTPTVSCNASADASTTCPSGQQCAAWGVCEGASCANDTDCPVEQVCISGACHAMGCI